jgi:hypothetical protein
MLLKVAERDNEQQKSPSIHYPPGLELMTQSNYSQIGLFLSKLAAAAGGTVHLLI